MLTRREAWLAGAAALALSRPANAMLSGPKQIIGQQLITLAMLRARRTMFCVVHWGQSLACGVNAQSYSSVSAHGHQMFGSGVKSMDPANIFVVSPVGPPLSYPEPSGPGTTTISPGTTTMIGLAEDGNYAWADSGTVVAGETSITASLDAMSGLVQSNASGFTDNLNKWFGTAPARGGEQIVTLIPGGTDWRNMQAHLRDFINLAWAAGYYPMIAAMVFTQGQADATDGTPYATYLANLNLIIPGFYAEVTAQLKLAGLPAQSFQPAVFINQLSHKVGNTGGPIAQAQFDAVAQNPGAYLLQPDYMYPHYSDNLHLLADGYALRGATAEAQALFKVLYRDGASATTCIMPTTCGYSAARGTIEIAFKVPTKPLRLAGDNIVSGAAAWALTNQNGFRCFDGTSDIALTNIAVKSDGVTVTLTPARAPVAPATLNYGLDYLSSSNTVGNIVGGANGDLKDSTPGTFTRQGQGTAYNLVQWAPHFGATVAVGA